MSLCKKQFGRLSTGEDVSLYLLEAGDYKASWCDYGATWLSFVMPDRRGIKDDVILGFSSFPPYAGKHPYFGATIGRVANRIADSKFALEGKEYKLFANDGKNHLHGGRRGFNRSLWSAEMNSIGGDPALRFSLLSPDGDEGYPGNLEIALTITLKGNGELSLDYEAESDKPTPLNLTNHAYFNLSGEGAGTILNHRLTLNCSHYLRAASDLIPIQGTPALVEGSSFDFRQPKPMGKDLGNGLAGYDHCFVIDSPDLLKPFAFVSEENSGRKLSVSTTSPAVQFYTGNFLDGIIGKHGSMYGKHSGFCLETEYYPDSPNRPDFQSCLAEPGKKWHQATKYSFSIH